MSQQSVLKQNLYKIKNIENESDCNSMNSVEKECNLYDKNSVFKKPTLFKSDPLINGFTMKDEKEFISDLEKPSVHFFNMAVQLNLHTDQEMNQENYEIDINKLL